jgi:hypothetical protein
LEIGVLKSFAEPHHFEDAPAPGKNFDAAPAPAAKAPATTQLYTKPTLKKTKVIIRVRAIFFFLFLLIQIVKKN